MSETKAMRTSITVVLDRSGSMADVCDDAIGGFNTFLKAQQKEAAGTTLTLTQFDNEYEIVCLDRPVAQVEPLTTETYCPRGGTALNDAIARSIVELEKRIEAAAPEARPERVVVVILTDGQENSSVEFSTAEVKGLIERHRTERGWAFVFLGADMDAFAEGAQYGIQANQAYCFSKQRQGTERVFSAMADVMERYRMGEDFAFSEDDRKKGA